ncbi:hypothetical protein BX070DRAFT_231642 [Coemansia spiralis]|nr:hypothetical protein BX070DRAFT_231642 [Coemansia spiralis]
MLGGGAVGRPPAALAAVKRSNTVGPARRGFFNSIFNRSASNEEPADSSSDGAAVLVQSPQGISAATNNAKQAPPPRMLPSLSSGARLGESVVRPPTASHEPITEESPGAVAEEEAQSKLAATTNSNVFAQAFEAIRNMPKPEFTAATPAVVNRSNMPDDYFGIVCSSSIDGQYVNAVVSPIMSMGMFSQAGGPPTANAADWRRSVLGHLGAAGDENNNRRGGLASMMDGTTPTPGSPSSIYAEGSAALASPRVK